MSEIEFRHGQTRFFDDQRYARGFAKSGDFTLVEEELLIRYGDTMLSLENGELLPENSEEKHFVKVVNNPTKAKTQLERLWIKYVQLSRGYRRSMPLNSHFEIERPTM
ncbi:DUF413 domain-containing protein [Aliivibrio kagoshimensis]|jgi:uncharacterized protein YifE (UPF0438 family)|uniref:DUF413 domain-containing protein n=1 Tax=Aliivibrio kagoshimensis TaxID=2910230 RepID=UPI003D0A330B